MQTFSLEPDTLASIQSLTDDPAGFVRQAVQEKLERMGAGLFSDEELAALASLELDDLLSFGEENPGSS